MKIVQAILALDRPNVEMIVGHVSWYFFIIASVT